MSRTEKDLYELGRILSGAHQRLDDRQAGVVPDNPAGLTPLEVKALRGTAELARLFDKIVGSGPTRERDLDEVIFHIHALQRMIGAQAAARLNPSLYRLLGDVIGGHA